MVSQRLEDLGRSAATKVRARLASRFPGAKQRVKQQLESNRLGRRVLTRVQNERTERRQERVRHHQLAVRAGELPGRAVDVWPLWGFEGLPVVTVVVPIFDAFESVVACVGALVRNTWFPAELLLIDDGSLDPRVGVFLDGLVAAGVPGVRVLRNEVNLGFVRTVNRGFAESVGDVVLLNSDVEVVPGWLRGLVVAGVRFPGAASVTALSDNSDAFSAPVIGVLNEVPVWLGRDGVGRLVAQGAGRVYPFGPTGNGFCFYMRRAALDSVGGFDFEAFPRGYGEENDWCMRALGAGWSHVVDDSVYVFHEKSASFGGEKHELMAAGGAVIEERYPEYLGLVSEFLGGELMVEARGRVGVLFGEGGVVLPRVLMVLHGGGGGTLGTVGDLVDGLGGRFEVWVLVSSGDRVRLLRRGVGGGEVLVESWELGVGLGAADFSRSDYVSLVGHVLSRYGIEVVHVQHLIGHTFDVPRVAGGLGIPVVVSVHDYYFVCPSVHLLDGQDRFCGGVCTAGQDECRLPTAWVSDHIPHVKHSGVYVWQERVREMFGFVGGFVAPSPSVRDLYVKVFPEVADRFEVIEHGRELHASGAGGAGAGGVGVLPLVGGLVRILVAGSVEAHKGLGVIQALKALDVQGRLEFHFVGDESGVLSGLGVVHGLYEREEYAGLAAAIAPAFAGLFSITAETYSHTLTEAWLSGVPVLASDLGAFRDRVNAHGGGWLFDPADVEGLYELILSIVDEDRESYERVRAELADIAVRSIPEMAADYEVLYRQLLSQGRAFGGLEPRADLLRVGVVVRGEGGRFTGAAHVRALLRYWHESVADQLVPIVIDPVRVMAHRDAVALDVVVVERNALDPTITEAFVAEMKRRNIKLVVDLDDDLVNLPESHPHYNTYDQAVRESISHLVQHSDLLTVSTNTLKDRLTSTNPNIVVLPNLLDEHLWLAPLANTPTRTTPPANGVTKVLYFGDESHIIDLELVRDAFENNPNLSLGLVGITNPDQVPTWAHHIAIPNRNYPQFVPWLRHIATDYHIAIAPLQNTEWAANKSDLKYLEATALGLPVIASNTTTYNQTITHNHNGLLADPDTWTTHLTNLATNPTLQQTLTHNATTYLHNHRLMQHQTNPLTRFQG